MKVYRKKVYRKCYESIYKEIIYSIVEKQCLKEQKS